MRAGHANETHGVPVNAIHRDSNTGRARPCPDARASCAVAGGVASGGLGSGLVGLMLTRGTSLPPWEVFTCLLLFGLLAGLGTGIYAHHRWPRADFSKPATCWPRVMRRVTITAVLAWTTCFGVSASGTLVFVAGALALPLFGALAASAVWLMGRAVFDLCELRRSSLSPPPARSRRVTRQDVLSL